MRDKATEMISGRIKNQIFEKCQELEIKNQWASLFDMLKQESNIIKDNFHKIDLIIRGNSHSLPLTDRNQENWQSCTSSPKSGISPAEIFFIVLTAPIWIPAGIIAIPLIFLGKKIDIIRYKMNKISFMNKFAKEIIEKYDTDEIYNGLCLMLLQKFMQSLNEICDNIIPKQIKAYQELLENIVKENRDTQTILQEYRPIERHCADTIGKLLYVKIKYCPKKPIRILKEGDFIGKGSYAEVYKCDVDTGECKLECAVKRLTTALQHPDRYLQLSEAENMM